jgi:uncharacterized protein (DUF427 family)
MTEIHTRKEPGPDHPISIHPNSGHVTVRHGSAVIAETDRALELREANHAPVLYIPLADVDEHLLSTNEQQTYCPYKGDASYYDIDAGDGDVLVGAVWYYPDAYSAVEAIRGHIAFYPDRVTITNAS